MESGVQINPYKIRSELLMEATNYTGVCSPKKAALVWAEGLKLRNAAIQYTVMTKALKSIYAKQLETSTSQGNWVTGMSSPWIESYTILSKIKISYFEVKVIMNFHAATSAGLFDSYKATLSILKEDPFWRISKIDMDKDLYVYTGFQA